MDGVRRLFTWCCITSPGSDFRDARSCRVASVHVSLAVIAMVLTGCAAGGTGRMRGAVTPTSSRVDTFAVMMPELADRRRASANVRFYLDVGTNERSRDTDPDVVDVHGRRVTYPRAYLEGSEAVADALLASGVAVGNLRHLVDDGAMHHEAAWSNRFEGAVQWLYQ